MTYRGIPPCDDKILRDRTRAAILVILSVAAFSLLLFLSRDVEELEPTPKFRGPVSGLTEPTPADLAEIERASAYKVVRDAMAEGANDPDIEQVACRDSWHKAILKNFTFWGEADIFYKGGRVRRVQYKAQLHGSSEDGWVLRSLVVAGEKWVGD